MSKVLFSFIITLAVLFISACNEHHQGVPDLNAQADSLLKEVIDGHDEAMMAQMTKMKKAKESVNHLIDSIGNLPGKANEATTALKEQLNSTLSDLNKADLAMNTWMSEFNYDSLKDNAAERIKYLKDEKLKVGEVKEAILGSLAKADSLLKKKF